ncbi:MAG: hypothetical protein WDO24_02565 [Pseudomonadota bacterium]
MAPELALVRGIEIELGRRLLGGPATDADLGRVEEIDHRIEIARQHDLRFPQIDALEQVPAIEPELEKAVISVDFRQLARRSSP